LIAPAFRSEEVPLNSPDGDSTKRLGHFRFTQPSQQSGFVGHPVLCEFARELEILLASRNVRLNAENLRFSGGGRTLTLPLGPDPEIQERLRPGVSASPSCVFG
jgi:hypothetical protein